MVEHNPIGDVSAKRRIRMRAHQRATWRDQFILVLGYLVLDWASYIHPLHGLNITPWNPAPALGLVFLLRFGRRAVPGIAVAIVLAETMVRGLPISLPLTSLVTGLIVICYWLIAHTLRRVLPADALLSDRRSLLRWATVVIAGTLINSSLVVSALSLGGYVPEGEIATAIMRYWVGDAAGTLIAMPLLMMLFDAGGRGALNHVIRQSFSPILSAITLLALWVAFGPGASMGFHYAYVLFLPVAWAAAREGLPGAVIAAAAVQLGIIIAVQWQGVATVTVIDIQMLAGAIALFGFFIGMVVDETRRIGAELQQTLRLAAAGEMAGALAHELNQPLTALGTYGSACEQLLARNETGELLREAVRGMVRESQRAAEVMRRLRDFFRTGSTRLETVTLAELMATALARAEQRARRDSISLAIERLPDCKLLCDRLQIEVVLHNLVTNAADAVSAAPPERRWIRLYAQHEDMSSISITVEDGGPGFDENQLATLFSGFQSTKSSGLGLGLIISRAIVEAHGGSLWAEPADHGIFRLTLEVESEPKDAKPSV